ncbi:MAG: NAD(P)/FAD-dependent oxidoreductase [Armatimonadota bacterium]
MSILRSCQPKVAVVGAGLAGVSVALELASRGMSVVLIDQDVRPVNRASRRNEGKIHLGFVYANEPDRETMRLMVDGAMVFGPLMRRWLGRCPEASTQFQYLVHCESVVTPEEFAVHCAAVETYARAVQETRPDADYLGARPGRFWRPSSPEALETVGAGGEIAAAFVTEERAVDTDLLSLALAKRVLEDDNIDFQGGVEVNRFEQAGTGYRLHGTRDGAPWQSRADLLVNCTWERRSALDATLGIAPPADILHRLKYRLILKVPPVWRDAVSMTMVVGPYGDIVIRRDGTAFLSWYPVGRQGWSTDIEPPRDWDAPSSGRPDPVTANRVADGILSNLDRFYPGIGASEVLQIDAGPIVAIGRSDVGDKGSGLHHRCEVGYREHGTYFTLDPGKLTTAPLFGVRLAERIDALVGGIRPRSHRFGAQLEAANA